MEELELKLSKLTLSNSTNLMTNNVSIIPKNTHVVIDGLNILLIIQNAISKNCQHTGDMDFKDDGLPDHFITNNLDFERIFSIFTKFLNFFPEKSTIHMVFKKTGSKIWWKHFTDFLFDKFIESNDTRGLTYRIYIAKPQAIYDHECDDRLVNVLAQKLSVNKKNIVHILSNDNYKSLSFHEKCESEYELLDSDYDTLLITKPQIFGFIHKHRIQIFPQSTSNDCNTTLICKLLPNNF